MLATRISAIRSNLVAHVFATALMSCLSFDAGGPDGTTNSWTIRVLIAPVEYDRGRTVCTSARSARFY